MTTVGYGDIYPTTGKYSAREIIFKNKNKAFLKLSK
jgi:hypothetical protein